MRACLLTLAALLPACGDAPPLAFALRPIPVGYDRAEVVDATAIDPDHDGDFDLLVATAADFRYVQHEAGRWTDASVGTALDGLPAVSAMHPDGDDYILVRDGALSRLVYSGIGSWHEADGPVPEQAPAPVTSVDVDLDGDGRLDRARLEGAGLTVLMRGPDGKLVDVSTAVGASGFRAAKIPGRLLAADLDGDGDTDLAVAGPRLVALLNNGGKLSP